MPTDDLARLIALSEENRRLRAALELDGLEGHALRSAEEWARLRAKVVEQRRENTMLRQCLEAKNDLLWATHLIVGCTAACRPSAGPPPDTVTDERVAAVRKVADRLETWWANHKARKAAEAKT